MKSPGRVAMTLHAILVGLSSFPVSACAQSPKPTEAPKPAQAGLAMTKAVACKRIEGYERFIPLADAALTSDDKLQVYYRPLNFRVDPAEKPSPGRRFRARFDQDGRIRRKGEKTVLMKKDRILEYDPVFETASERIYLTNSVGLKGLAPGDYEYDIVLRDGLEDGSSTTQTLPFKIIPTPKFDPPAIEERPAEPDSPAGPAKVPSDPNPKPKGKAARP